MTAARRILLTGARGQVGWELRRTLGCLGEVVALDSRAMNLADADAVRQTMRDIAPSIIVNPAAYTAVDKAESEPELAHAVNAVAPGILAEEAARLNALLVHYSTDYVFNGSGSTPWKEDAACDPLNVYGATKLAGERAIGATGCRHLIFRTSWVYGARGSNFLLTMRRLMRERPELKIVADQVGAPTWCRDLAEATALVLSQVAAPANRVDEGDFWGVYHMTNAGETSWHGFAGAIQAHDGAGVRLRPIPSSDYPTPARRPLNSRLNNDKLKRTFGISLQDWRAALALCLEADNKG
ncbi:dTDP-4-dehydrorhamnose reductase [Thiobacillus sp.]|uniref:dTDP-4-dehydrorhamnose reductase n=1 Tax=Thiobacillus sp. TaxID=924 RepID=UPI0017A1F3E2|nr:dTDP-4-dehydrorhamnose reductase [Thiobacillus sp.]MBC2732602.1 dTDP-4-dehydrorhamnose reductase [Thiobacillus sp.]MBC2741339.1 dTDP-4-dehydrorhamnose reductase [Thiobacillus sp.]MBC2759116.1 dTDP-4-dehydrorhamnose reductase [Thiobacillus sp.]